MGIEECGMEENIETKRMNAGVWKKNKKKREGKKNLEEMNWKQ